MTKAVDPFFVEVIDRLVQDLVGLNNQQASAEIQKLWPEIWGTAEPFGLTKYEAHKLAWHQFKAARRASRATRAKG